MPEPRPKRRARAALRRGKKPTTAASPFVREEMHHIREGKHGARSTKQAIAIGLSKARRAGVPLRPPTRGPAKRRAERDLAKGSERRRTSPKRAAATKRALQREPRSAASHRALSRQAKRTATARERARSRS